MLEYTKLGMDAAAGAITVGALLGYLPPLAAFLSIVWLCIQIYDRLTKGRA